MRTKKIVRFGVIVLFLLILIAAMVWYSSSASIAERYIIRTLNDRGVAHVSLKVQEMDSSHVIINDLIIGEHEEVKIGRAEIFFTVAGLREGRVQRIVMDNPQIRVTMTEKGWSLGELDALVKPEEKQNGVMIPALPFEALQMTNAHAAVAFADGSEIRMALASFDIQKLQPDPVMFSYALGGLVVTGGADYTVPLEDNGQITINGSHVQLEGHITDAGKRLNAPYEMRHDMASGKGAAKINLRALTFASGDLQPSTLFPVMSGVLGETSGAIAADGLFTWDKDGLKDKIVISVQKLSTKLADAVFTNVNGKVTLGPLAPLSTPSKQSLTVDALDIGLPLTDGKISFAIAPYKKLMLYSTDWSWAGGRLKTKPITVDLAAPRVQKATLVVDKVELNQALAMFLKDEVAATGTISGEVPVIIRDGQIRIENGLLASGESGTIKYTPKDESPLAASGNEQTNMLMGALKNFHYKSLSLTVNSEEGNDMSVLLSVSGNNPSFYDGKAVILNIQLHGDLVQIVKQNIDAYSIPEQLEKKFAPHTP